MQLCVDFSGSFCVPYPLVLVPGIDLPSWRTKMSERIEFAETAYSGYV